jgi:hypothetical protein
MTKWIGGNPTSCDTCATTIEAVFYDAKTNIQGKWACMCPSCFTLGPGLNKLGPGYGQRYERQEDGNFIKTGG